MPTSALQLATAVAKFSIGRRRGGAGGIAVSSFGENKVGTFIFFYSCFSGNRRKVCRACVDFREECCNYYFIAKPFYKEGAWHEAPERALIVTLSRGST